MSFDSILTLGQTALELGLISSLTVLALFLSYSMLNVCDLSTDGCFTLGAVVGASVALSGHPFLAIPAAMAIGMVSGFVTALLQTKMGIDSLLAGIIVNNGIVYVDCVNQLRLDGMEKHEAMIEAGRRRLRPILMTALTTICSMFAMVFSQEMGAEMIRPMAIVATGGLIYATVLTLFLVPALYDLFQRKAVKAVAIEEDEIEEKE